MLASLGHHIDTSNLRPNALRAGIKAVSYTHLTLPTSDLV